MSLNQLWYPNVDSRIGKYWHMSQSICDIFTHGNVKRKSQNPSDSVIDKFKVQSRIELHLSLIMSEPIGLALLSVLRLMKAI